MDKYELSFNEWHEKTNWVQDDKRFDVLLPWGKHRADVMKEYICLLESRIADMAVQLANAESKCSEMAAENAGLKSAIEIAEPWLPTCDEELAHRIEQAKQTPATDAFLAEVRARAIPSYVMAAIQKVARIRIDLNDFDGDKRGIVDCLGEAEESLIEVVNKFAAQLRKGAAL